VVENRKNWLYFIHRTRTEGLSSVLHEKQWLWQSM